MQLRMRDVLFGTLFLLAAMALAKLVISAVSLNQWAYEIGHSAANIIMLVTAILEFIAVIVGFAIYKNPDTQTRRNLLNLFIAINLFCLCMNIVDGGLWASATSLWDNYFNISRDEFIKLYNENTAVINERFACNGLEACWANFQTVGANESYQNIIPCVFAWLSVLVNALCVWAAWTWRDKLLEPDFTGRTFRNVISKATNAAAPTPVKV